MDTMRWRSPRSRDSSTGRACSTPATANGWPISTRRWRPSPPRRTSASWCSTGAGRAFCTGVDLTELAAGHFGLEDFIAWEDAMIAIERMDRLFVAGINGHCLGGGLQLALVCDYRLASEDALLGLPAVKECLIPSCALYRLPRLIGAARAQELILLGEPLAARTAERYSLVNRVVPAAEFPAPSTRRSSASWRCHPPASGPASSSPRAPSTWTSKPSGRRCRPTSRSAWPPKNTARRWRPSAPVRGDPEVLRPAAERERPQPDGLLQG